MTGFELKREVMVIAGFLAEQEAMKYSDNEMSLQRVVSRIAADSTTGHTMLALIAVTLARHIDEIQT